MSLKPYMRRYTLRLSAFMIAYAAILVAGLTAAKGDLSDTMRIAWALATAAPICGVFWTIFRVLEECEDEYQRMLFVRQTLLGTAITLAITTVWQFLQVYEVLAQGPKWIGVIWLAMFGVAAPIVRWRA